MFCKSISRVARSTTSLPVSSVSAARTSAGSAQAASCKASALYQRRHSSSKPSCPPGGSGKSESDAATENPTRRSTNSTRLPRRKAKEAAEEIALKARDAAFARLPAVPPTSHMSELDVKMASVFSMHRPISVTTPWPQHTTTASFNSIFDTRSSPAKVSDVIYTLSNTVSAMEGATTGQHTQEEKDLRWELLQESASHNAASPLHGTRGGPRLFIDKIVSQYRPFNVPPAPVPFSEKREAAATESQPQQQAAPEPQAKTFTTTLTISESISSTGRKTYTASASPIVEQDAKSRPRARLIVREREAARVQARTARTEVGVPETILEEEEEETDGRSMQLISVKRQRKLKMKKHKYKKLMRRTRNLRRRIGRA